MRRYVNATLQYLVTGAPAAPSAIQLTVLEPTSLAAMVGVNVLITGRISRPGTVALSGLGAATVASDLTWSYLFAPSSAGSLPITITATDDVNGTISSVTITLTVAAAATYPAVTPLARFQHNAPAFADLSGATPANAPHALVRRVNNVVPLSGFWQSSPAAFKDTAGVRVEPASITAYAYPLEFVASPGAAIKMNDSTLVMSWVQRWGQFTPLICTGANPLWGVTTVADLCAIINNGASSLGFPTAKGKRHSLIVRWTPTNCKAKLLIDGAVAGTITIPATITAGNPGAGELRVGHVQSFAYGTIVEIGVINSAVNDTLADQLLAYVDSIPTRPAFPVDQPLYAATGDSNTFGVGASQYVTPKFAMLRALRASHNFELLCTALVGTGVTGHAGYIAPFYDARRRVHIASCAAGINNLIGLNPVAPMLADYFAELDAMRAQGWKAIAVTVQDRRDYPAQYSSFRPMLDQFNAGIRAGSAHYDALCDLAAVPELGDVNAADNTTYFSTDKIHFTDAGQELIQAPMQAAVLACYALT